MKSSVYTHTGDKGTTGLVGGTRIPKDDIRIEAYGTIDELNSYVGLLRSYVSNTHDSEFLLDIQHRLFMIGSILATDISRVDVKKIMKITADNVKSVETEIDAIDTNLPRHNKFIIPGGCRASSVAHICRTVCRRSERRIYTLEKKMSVNNEELLKYINRLSDYFFVLSRKVNLDYKADEIFWNNTCL